MIENCHQGASGNEAKLSIQCLHFDTLSALASKLLGPGMVSAASKNNNCTGLTPTSDCPFNFWYKTIIQPRLLCSSLYAPNDACDLQAHDRRSRARVVHYHA
jgi:hypothetical protein